MKINFIPKISEGFSLIELVVVVSVLSILAAIGIPSFNCFQKRAKAAAALTTLQQIKKEFIINKNQFTRHSILMATLSRAMELVAFQIHKKLC